MPIVQDLPKPDADESQISNPRAEIGGNSPPIEKQIAMEFREALLGERPDFLARMNGAIDAVARAVVTDDETLGKAGDLAKILRACDSYITEVHKSVKQPHLDRGRACDSEKNALTSKIAAARSKLSDVMNEFMAKVEAKRRAEEAERQAAARAAAAEAERAEREARDAEEAARRAVAEANSEVERAAAAREAERARAAATERAENAALAAHAPTKAEPVRSDAGSSVSGRTVWNSEVEDYAKAFKNVKGDAKVREAIDAAILRRVKAGDRELAGCRIWPTTQAIAR